MISHHLVPLGVGEGCSSGPVSDVWLRNISMAACQVGNNRAYSDCWKTATSRQLSLWSGSWGSDWESQSNASVVCCSDIALEHDNDECACDTADRNDFLNLRHGCCHICMLGTADLTKITLRYMRQLTVTTHLNPQVRGRARIDLGPVYLGVGGFHSPKGNVWAAGQVARKHE